jgi:hypothetical protein
LKRTNFGYSNFKNDWKNAWNYRPFKIQLIITFIILLLLALFINDFFCYSELRQGRIINDFILNWIPARNVSLYIFFFIYSVIILSLVNLSSYPLLFLKCLQAYCLLTIMRIISIYLFPLEPPAEMITMKDPFVDQFFYNHLNITKDLFFSGHIGTLFLLFLACPSRKLKRLYLIFTFITAILIMIQHVHYTVDIIVAPLFSWFSFKFVQKIPL